MLSCDCMRLGIILKCSTSLQQLVFSHQHRDHTETSQTLNLIRTIPQLHCEQIVKKKKSRYKRCTKKSDSESDLLCQFMKTAFKQISKLKIHQRFWFLFIILEWELHMRQLHELMSTYCYCLNSDLDHTVLLRDFIDALQEPYQPQLGKWVSK